MNKIKLYLIRHGKTYCNEKQLYCGKSDIELSENGIKELNENLKIYDYPKCEYYFTSGAKRANKTLEILYPNKKYEIHKKLFEYDFGDFELKSYNDLKDKKEYIKWINDDTDNVCCENGESRSQFKERIKTGFEDLIKYLSENNIKSAVGVTHGGTIGMLLEMFYDDSKKFYEYQPKNGEGYEITIELEENNKFNISEIKKIDSIKRKESTIS